MILRITRVIFSMLCVLTVPSGLWAQAKSIYGPMSEMGKDNLPGQKIGPNDLIAISVYDAPELTRSIRVSGDGSIRLPMLKERLRAQDLLPVELETLIASALQEEGILVDPIVIVTVAEYHSRPINVMGSVKKPLTFQATGNVTLLEALGKAEGLASDAGPEILLSRANPTNPSAPLVERIAVRELIDQARPDLNFQLFGGEEIRVPEARKIYVAGNVKKPGAIPVRDGSPITVLKALGISEGLVPYYKKTAYILRPDDMGTKQEIPVELNQILARKSEDLALRAEDILYIPDDNKRRVTMNIIEKAAGFSTATISGFLIWRGR